ncbi:Maf family nucleotide pyrophosphatase [Simiduia curdlanivorans]|uniref:Nucleoside triphosphate pyrophosphatase n=1 Tax=Simiduia curdlanivorans TaxID=1492769 RepID=A0ABV8V942_9GAMM|nr:Maf family nucleotide pyrophosphatase [Simiduia curdlanivorans]MDN3639731.1 Maf family nucleotide pyrophosphatase [Simiduia curdlanivorans]
MDDFTCHAPDIDESPLATETPAQMAPRLAKAKALALAQHYPDALIIGSDQTASCDGLLLNKPGTEANALAQLKRCQGKTVTFYTGLCLLNSSNQQLQLQTVATEVSFLSLTDAQLQIYIRKEQPLDCAGSFKCEALGSSLFQSLTSTDPSALEGLPLIALCAMLRREGFEPLS